MGRGNKACRALPNGRSIRGPNAVGSEKCDRIAGPKGIPRCKLSLGPPSEEHFALSTHFIHPSKEHFAPPTHLRPCVRRPLATVNTFRTGHRMALANGDKLSTACPKTAGDCQHPLDRLSNASFDRAGSFDGGSEGSAGRSLGSAASQFAGVSCKLLSSYCPPRDPQPFSS